MFGIFGIVLTLAYTALLAYVVWRASSVPVLARRLPRRAFAGIGVILWLVFFVGRNLARGRAGPLAAAFEIAGMDLLGAVFLFALAMLAVDLATLFGLAFKTRAPALRGCALVAGAVLSGVALVQAVRAPAVVSHEVALPSLPAELDGTVLVALSDAHLGSRLGAGWFAKRVAEVAALRPDVVAFLGDIADGRGAVPEAIAGLGELSPRLGKWFVDGNHDSLQRSSPVIPVLERAGFRRLGNESVALAPGLVLAGVEDLTAHARQKRPGDPLAGALDNRPAGACILLSHSPWQAERAASAGVELMLSGHTHGGQIWPFGYLVRTVYPLLEGRYEVQGMPVIVSRGVGTWGPRMRLWHRGEMVKVTLRSPQTHRVSEAGGS